MCDTIGDDLSTIACPQKISVIDGAFLFSSVSYIFRTFGLPVFPTFLELRPNRNAIRFGVAQVHCAKVVGV